MRNTNLAIIEPVKDEISDVLSEDDRIDKINMDNSHEQYVCLEITLSGDDKDAVARTAHSEIMKHVRKMLRESG